MRQLRPGENSGCPSIPLGITPQHTTEARAPTSTQRTKRLLDDLLLETLHERNHIALLGLGHLELRQGRCRVTEKDAPVALADAHASMAERHVPAAVVHWAARARAEEVDQELLFTIDAVLPAMRPEAPELRIGLKTR